MKPLFMAVAGLQVLLFALAAQADGWLWYALLIGCMACVFGAIPFSDAIVVRYVDDSMRSRVSGARLAVSYSIGALAVWLLGPAVKAAGFATLLGTLSALAALTFIALLWLPGERAQAAALETAR
jgi:thiol:disulfide interchange protein